MEKKKLAKALFAAVICTLCLTGCNISTHGEVENITVLSSKYPEVEEEQELYGLSCDYSKQNETNFMRTYDYVKPVIDNTDTKYIFYTWENQVFACTQESLEARMKEYNSECFTECINDLDTAERSAVYMINHMTGRPKQHDLNDGSNGTIYWSFSGCNDTYDDPIWKTLSAFENTLDLDIFRYQGSRRMTDNVLRQMKLKLDVTNAQVDKVMVVEDLIYAGMYYMEVTADVKTERKPEAFKNLDWIPDEGESAKTTFVICFMSDPRNSNSNFIVDLAIKGQTIEDFEGEPEKE